MELEKQETLNPEARELWKQAVTMPDLAKQKRDWRGGREASRAIKREAEGSVWSLSWAGGRARESEALNLIDEVEWRWRSNSGWWRLAGLHGGSDGFSEPCRAHEGRDGSQEAENVGVHLELKKEMGAECWTLRRGRSGKKAKSPKVQWDSQRRGECK